MNLFRNRFYQILNHRHLLYQIANKNILGKTRKVLHREVWFRNTIVTVP
ncbi:hypothetical protein LEP1GSC198_2723 [Leptospira kirschneri str. JB]|nr:hypothetical protein LEP1GSC198_2723 [Leptospira kirschneri str. JB]